MDCSLIALLLLIKFKASPHSELLFCSSTKYIVNIFKFTKLIIYFLNTGDNNKNLMTT